MDGWNLKQCDVQGRLFELSAEKGLDSKAFIKAFMLSDAAKALDSPYSHMQWAGEEYLLEDVAEKAGLSANTPAATFPEDVMYWTGYLYRYWHFLTGEGSARIYRQAPADTMRRNYLMFHTMGPSVAVENLKEIAAQKP